MDVGVKFCNGRIKWILVLKFEMKENTMGNIVKQSLQWKKKLISNVSQIYVIDDNFAGVLSFVCSDGSSPQLRLLLHTYIW